MKTIVGISVLAGALSWAAPANASKWIQKNPSGTAPSERSAPATAALGNKVYLFGGVMDDFATGVDTFYDDMYRYNSNTNRWRAVTPSGASPHARAFAASADHQGLDRMYVFGGAHYGPFFSDFIAFDDLWSYSPDSNTWTQVVADNAGPAGRAGAAMWIDEGNDSIYIFGGVDAFFGVHNDLWVYDICANLWTNLIADGDTGSPPARHVSMHTIHPKNHRATIYGGESIDQATFEFTTLADAWQYNLNTNSWANVTPATNNLDPARNYAAFGLINNALVLQGGDVPGGEDGCGSPFPQNVTEEIWKFNLSQHTWTQVSPNGDALVRLKRTASAVIGDVMYVFSGWDFQCPGGVGPGQVWNTNVWAYKN